MNYGDDELGGRHIDYANKTWSGDENIAMNHVSIARNILGDLKNRMQLGGVDSDKVSYRLRNGVVISASSSFGIDKFHISTEGYKEEKEEDEIVLGYIVRCISNDVSTFNITVDLPGGETFDLSLVGDGAPFATTTDLGLEALATNTGFSDNGCKLVDVREYNDLDELVYTDNYQAVCPTFIENTSEVTDLGVPTMTAGSFTGTNPDPPYTDLCTVVYQGEASRPPTIGGTLIQDLISITAKTASGDPVSVWNDYRDDAISAMNAFLPTVHAEWISYYNDNNVYDGSVYLNYAGTYTISNASLRSWELWRKKNGHGFLLHSGVIFNNGYTLTDKGSSYGDMCFFMVGMSASNKVFSYNQSIQTDINGQDSLDSSTLSWRGIGSPSPNAPVVTLENSLCLDSSGAMGMFFSLDIPEVVPDLVTIDINTDSQITDSFGVDIVVPFGQHKCHVESLSNVDSTIEIHVFTTKKIIKYTTEVLSFQTKNFTVNVGALSDFGTDVIIEN